MRWIRAAGMGVGVVFTSACSSVSWSLHVPDGSAAADSYGEALASDAHGASLAVYSRNAAENRFGGGLIVVKYDARGDIEWSSVPRAAACPVLWSSRSDPHQRASPPSVVHHGYGFAPRIRFTADGGSVLVAATVITNAHAVCVVRLDAHGAVKWASVIREGVGVTALAVDRAVRARTFVGGRAPGERGFLLALDDDGATRWRKELERPPEGVGVDAHGNMIVIVRDAYDPSTASSTSPNARLFALSADGEDRWESRFRDANQTFLMDVDASGAAYLATARIQPEESTLTRRSAAGEPEWSRGWKGAIVAIATGEDGRVAVARRDEQSIVISVLSRAGAPLQEMTFAARCTKFEPCSGPVVNDIALAPRALMVAGNVSPGANLGSAGDIRSRCRVTEVKVPAVGHYGPRVAEHLNCADIAFVARFPLR